MFDLSQLEHILNCMDFFSLENAHQQFSFQATAIQYRKSVNFYVILQTHCIASERAMNSLDIPLSALEAHIPTLNK